MRRWFEINADSSNSNWQYNPFVGGSRFWFGMPTKSQLDDWQNYAQNLYCKLGVYNPGSNPDFVCGSGEIFGNPDENYDIVQNFVRLDTLIFFSPIYPTANLTLFNATTVKPLGDWADPTHPAWHVDHRRKAGDRLQP